MRPTISQYATSLEELSLGATAEEAVLLVKIFFGLLKRRGEEKKIGAIFNHLEKINDVKENRVVVRVALAHEADTATKEKLSLQAQRLFPHKKVVLQYTIDTKVIGGVTFRTDELLYDATLLNKLKDLKAVLTK